jgi:hypothetical protein
LQENEINTKNEKGEHIKFAFLFAKKVRLKLTAL